MAQEIQNLADCNNIQGFYDALKALYGPRKRAIVPVRSADGSMLFKGRHEILARWANHFESLFNHTNPADLHILDNLPDLPPTKHLDTPPLYSELRQAIAGLKNNKCAGPDGIPAEVFKHGGYKTSGNMGPSHGIGRMLTSWSFKSRKETEQSAVTAVEYPSSPSQGKSWPSSCSADWLSTSRNLCFRKLSVASGSPDPQQTWFLS